jgi:hypothetical protein
MSITTVIDGLDAMAALPVTNAAEAKAARDQLALVIQTAAETEGGGGGATWRSGAGAPSNALGADNDFYMDLTLPGAWWGPKASGSWAGTGPHSMQGPQGEPGVGGDSSLTYPLALMGS